MFVFGWLLNFIFFIFLIRLFISNSVCLLLFVVAAWYAKLISHGFFFASPLKALENLLIGKICENIYN